MALSLGHGILCVWEKESGTGIWHRARCHAFFLAAALGDGRRTPFAKSNGTLYKQKKEPACAKGDKTRAPCGRSTPSAAPRRSHVDACVLCVVRRAQRWRLEIKKRSISLKTCITSWSLGPPPLCGFMHVAGLNRFKRCPDMLMRFRSGEARGVAFYKKNGKCKRELRPPPRRRTLFRKKSK